MEKNITLIIWIIIICFKGTNLQRTCLSKRISLSYFQCVIGYNTCTDSKLPQKETLVFDFCLQKDCISSDCSAYQQVLLEEPNCIKRCCNAGQIQQMTFGILNTCIATNNQLSSNTQLSIYKIVIIAVASSLIFIFCLVGCIRNRERCFCRCCQRVEEDARSQGDEYVGQVVKWVSQVESVNNLNQFPSSKDLRQPNGQQTPCCICLETQTNCTTFCNHRFHILCLKEWIQKKRICPLCTTKNFNPLKVTCQNCDYMWALYFLNSHPLPNQFLAKTIICQYCSKATLPQSKKIENQERTHK